MLILSDSLSKLEKQIVCKIKFKKYKIKYLCSYLETKKTFDRIFIFPMHIIIQVTVHMYVPRMKWCLLVAKVLASQCYWILYTQLVSQCHELLNVISVNSVSEYLATLYWFSSKTWYKGKFKPLTLEYTMLKSHHLTWIC